jgi:RNA polymerase sigma-70 factor (ECF subfamily)
MERVQAGDQAAYRALLDDITGELRAFLARRTRDRSEVEDQLQEVLLAFHRARHTYDPSRRFESWLYAIARHVTIDAFRRSDVRARWEKPADSTTDLDPASGDDGREIALDAALAALPAVQREALEMVKLDGMKIEDAAARAGVTQGALRVRIHRGYVALRRRLLGTEE